MTDAAFKKSKKDGAMAGQRISTHPSYTEYSWDSIAPPKRPSPASNQRTNPNAARNQRPANGAGARVQRSAAAVNQRRDRMYGQSQAGANARTHAGARGNTQNGQQAAYSKEAARRRADAQRKAAENRAKASTALKKQTVKAERIRRKSIVAIHTIVADKKYSFPLAVVLIALCFTILIMAIVTTSVQITEITSENASLQREYNSLVSEENELRLRLETRDDLRVVETMAKTELGMVKKDEVDRYYLTVRKEDRIEIVEEEIEEKASILDGLLSFGGSIVERVRAFFGL